MLDGPPAGCANGLCDSDSASPNLSHRRGGRSNKRSDGFKKYIEKSDATRTEIVCWYFNDNLQHGLGSGILRPAAYISKIYEHRVDREN